MSLRSRNKIEKWHRIQAAAAQLFAERGFEKTTVRGIAQLAEVSTGTVLLYGKTKHALLFRLFAERVGPGFEQAMASAPDAPWVDRVSHLFDALIVAYRSDLRLAKTIIKELPFLEGEPGTAHSQMFGQLMTFLVESTARAQGRGELLANVAPEVIAQHTFSLYYGALIALVTGLAPEEAVSPMLRQSLQLQVRGLGAESEASP